MVMKIAWIKSVAHSTETGNGQNASSIVLGKSQVAVTLNRKPKLNLSVISLLDEI